MRDLTTREHRAWNIRCHASELVVSERGGHYLGPDAAIEALSLW